MNIRKILSAFLALCLVLCLIPVSAGAAETADLEVKSWPSSNTILSSGIYTIPADLNTKVTVNGNITVKLIGNASNTTDSPYSGLHVECKYNNTNLIIQDLNVTSTGSPVVEFAGTGNTLTLEGTSTFTGTQYGSAALVEVNGAHYTNNNTAAELTVNGTGTLNVTQPSDTYAAAIGGEAGAPCGNLTIAGGTVNAYTSGTGAAIGAGAGATSPSITISGGTVYAEACYAKGGWSYNHNNTGAAIGGGNGANGGATNITISGGTVTAVTGTNSAAIGSALYGPSSQGTDTVNITISGGKVFAFTESNSDVSTAGGAAIGSAYCGGSTNITVNGGEVVAMTGTAAAAIGAGAGGSYCASMAATVTVNGGTVTAFANSLYDSPSYKGPAIGKGCYGTSGNIYINGGAVMGVGNADKNINGIITDSNGNVLTEVVLEIPGVQGLSIAGQDWHVSANHADLTAYNGFDYTDEVHIWIPDFQDTVDMTLTTDQGTKNYDLWASGVFNEYHTVTYVLSGALEADGPQKVYDPITAPSWNEDLEGTLTVDPTAGCCGVPESISITVDGQAVDFTYNPRTGAFSVDGDLLTGDVVITAESIEKHNWVAADCDSPKTCSSCGATEGNMLGHDYLDGVCTRCGAGDPDYVAPAAVTRIYGDNRFTTALKVADEMKAALGAEKFEAIIIASGTNFADALSGSYLAAKKNAPILLAYNETYDQLAADYIKANLAENGTVYILGGDAAVSLTMEDKLSGLNVNRLAGKDRFETNILILEEAGVDADQTLLVCTGTNFADSLSASATGEPILLVWNESGKLRDCQKEFLDAHCAQGSANFRFIGGYSAVSFSMEKLFRGYGITDRLSGDNRFETSAALAKTYFGGEVETAVLAYAWNYPDGLCGGPLAYAMGAPLILTMTGYETAATTYTTEAGIESGLVLGGEKLISDASIRTIFAMDDADTILVK